MDEFACGVLFALRHARSARRSDLVLAGVALGIAAGTKWYGVSSVAVVGVVWVAARLSRCAAAVATATRATRAGHRRRHRHGRAVLRDAVLLGGLSLLGTLPWLARNLAPLRQPGLPAQGGAVRGDDLRRATRRHPRPGRVHDRRLRRRRDVLRQLAGEIVEGLGVAPILCAAALALALLLARRRGRAPDARVLVLVATAVALGLVYTVTPATALGLRGDPSLAHGNTRYVVPALLIAVPVVAWLAGRLAHPARLGLEALLRRPR